jgi:glycosyltransferase involved in cell wall biosynthesis
MAARAQNLDPGVLPRLCMDARMLVTSGGTGVSTYARELQRAHSRISETHVLLSDRPILDGPAPAPLGRAGRWLRALMPGVRQARPSATGENLLVAPDVFRIAQVYFDVHRRPLRVAVDGPPGLVHWTYPVPLVLAGWRNVYTVHDVIPLLSPELTHIDGARYQRLLDQLARYANCFITVSETARREIMQAIDCAPDFVVDCSLAVDATRPEIGKLPPPLIAGKFLLICGTVEKRKNVGRLLQAYRQSKIAMPLVIAGPEGWGATDVAESIEATPGVVRLPYLDRQTVRMLISQARALIMPSLAEGFGLPVAEAMALGTPVATSDRGALAETAGGAALAIDPYDISALAAGLRRLALDDAFCAALAAAGQHNAERFTPARFAERLTRAYADVMSMPT